MNNCIGLKQSPEMKYLEKVYNYKPIVSIFMLTHNRKEYLKLAIESVLNQKYGNFVLWVLNNSSTDNTEEYLSTLEDTRVIYSNTNVHPSINMRFARDTCKTKYFIILHDDDILESDYLDTVVAHMEQSNYAELSVAATFIDSSGNAIASQNGEVDKKEYIFQESEYLSNFINYPNRKDITFGSLIFPSIIYRTSFFQNIGEVFWAEAGPAGDQLVHFETERQGGRICYYAKSLIRYRIHETQDSKQNAGFMELQLIDYLLNDVYYERFLNGIQSSLDKKVWFLYRAIVGKVCRNEISRQKWKSVFSYECVSRLRRHSSGRILYWKMRIIYFFPFFSQWYYKIRKG